MRSMLNFEDSFYRTELTPMGNNQGRLSFFYGQILKDLEVKPDVFVDHSYSVLEGLFNGEFPSVTKKNKGVLKQIRIAFSTSTGKDKIPQNLSYLLLSEFPVFSELPEYNNGFKPLNKGGLDSFLRENGISLTL